jgi:hypothetical protein
MGLEEAGAAFAVEMEHFRQRLGWHDLEGPVQQALQGRTQQGQLSAPVQDSDSEPGATHQRLERCRVDRWE